MRNIAILTGGDSSEHDISLLSAQTVLQHLKPNLFRPYIILLKNNKFTAIVNKKKINVNKSNFTFHIGDNVIVFDAVFIALHGNPAENGNIQPYFDSLKIPYTSCNSAVSSLTFDKYSCNRKLEEFGFKCAQSYQYEKGEKINKEVIISKVSLPCFVKPNSGGSSYGITKVKQESELEEAIKTALKYDDKVIIEQFLDGMEISVGVYKNGKTIKSLPITEILTRNEFFDYQAKYEGKSEEITPARIKEELTNKIQETTINIYKSMQLNGICRIDYIVINQIAFIIEINTIPGLSKESIIPKQLKAAELELSEIFEICLLNTKNK